MARILCVEDEPADRLLLETTLGSAGHATLTARSHADARSALKGGDVDLVVLDYRMPDGTGLEFLEWFQDMGIGLPLIMLTGNVAPQAIVDAVKAGATNYLTKPVQPDELRRAIEAALLHAPATYDHDIFLSYSRTDVERVKPIVDVLNRRGWRVWWDPHIPKGQDFSDVIRDAIAVSRTMIVVWSEASVSSPWVRGEARKGRESELGVIPVRLDDSEPPIDFQSLQEVDLRHWSGEEEHVEIVAMIARLTEVLE